MPDLMSRYRWALLGIVIGFLGCVLSIFADQASPPARPSSISIQVRIGPLHFQRQSREEPPPALTWRERLWEHRDKYRFSGIGLGLAALLLSVVSWFHHEGKWPGLIAFTFGLGAIAWMYFVTAFGIVFLLGYFGYVPEAWFGGRRKPQPNAQEDTKPEQP